MIIYANACESSAHMSSNGLKCTAASYTQSSGIYESDSCTVRLNLLQFILCVHNHTSAKYRDEGVCFD